MTVEELFHALWELQDNGLSDAEIRKPGVVTGVAYDPVAKIVLLIGGPVEGEEAV